MQVIIFRLLLSILPCSIELREDMHSFFINRHGMLWPAVNEQLNKALLAEKGNAILNLE